MLHAIRKSGTNMLSRDRQNNKRRIFKCFRFIGRIVKGYSNATTKKEKNHKNKNDVTTSDIKYFI